MNEQNSQETQPEQGEIQLNEGERIEKFLRGKISLIQNEHGYRFSIDPILLTGFVDIKPDEEVLDLGAGSGVMSLILASRGLGRKIMGIEIQEKLLDQAERSAKLNGFEETVKFKPGDFMRIQDIIDANSYDVVISNPPYIRKGSGRVPSDEQRAIARHEISMNLGGMVAAASYAVKPGGRAYFVYPTNRLVDMLQICRQHELEPKMLQMVHNNESSRAKLVLLEAVNGGGPELLVCKPLFVYNLEGDYTDEVNGFLEEENKPGL